MASDIWSVAHAKARFSALIDQALTQGPQHVQRHGRDAVVVVSAAEWARTTAPARSVIDVLLDPAVRAILEPGEQDLFERDRTDNRSSPF